MTFETTPVILVDGSSYLFRAYHALPPLITQDGQPTGAIYGVFNMLRKLLQDYHPQYITAIFDSKETTFRHTLYPKYKAHREKMPDDLQQQIPLLFDLIKALGLSLITVDGVEADDVIATLAKRFARQGNNVLIATSDKDMAQLVNQQIHLANTMTGIILDEKGVEEKFGVSPHQIIDYLALIGDTSDNVPGVPKVGPKTAAKWLAQYNSLDTLLKHSDGIAGKIGETLRAHSHQLPLSRQLVTLLCDLDLPHTLPTLEIKKSDKDTLMSLYQCLEFKKPLTQLQQNEASTQPSDDRDTPTYHIITSREAFDALLTQLKTSRYVALDIETTSLNTMQAKVVGIALAVSAQEAFYIPVAHDYTDAPVQLDKTQVLKQLTPFLTRAHYTIIGQNLKYDYKVLARAGIVITAPMWDTLLASYVVDSRSARHDLASLAQRYLQRDVTVYSDVAGKGSKQIPFNQVALEQAGHYAAEDAQMAFQLHHTLLPLIERDPQAQSVLNDIELPLMPILADIERYGVLLDCALLRQQNQYLSDQLHILQQKIYDLASCEFNIDSPLQLARVLFEHLGLPSIKKNRKGESLYRRGGAARIEHHTPHHSFITHLSQHP